METRADQDLEEDIFERRTFFESVDLAPPREKVVAHVQDLQNGFSQES
jgi:hypothetical protein